MSHKDTKKQAVLKDIAKELQGLNPVLDGLGPKLKDLESIIESEAADNPEAAEELVTKMQGVYKQLNETKESYARLVGKH